MLPFVGKSMNYWFISRGIVAVTYLFMQIFQYGIGLLPVADSSKQQILLLSFPID